MATRNRSINLVPASLTFPFGEKSASLSATPGGVSWTVAVTSEQRAATAEGADPEWQTKCSQNPEAVAGAADLGGHGLLS